MIVCHQRTSDVRIYWDQWYREAKELWRGKDGAEGRLGNGDTFERVYNMTLCYDQCSEWIPLTYIGEVVETGCLSLFMAASFPTPALTTLRQPLPNVSVKAPKSLSYHVHYDASSAAWSHAGA